MNRRHFVKTAALAGASTLALRGKAWPFAQSPNNIRKFGVSLPGLGPTAKNEIGQYIPLAMKQTINFVGQTTEVYDMAAAIFSQRMHPDLPGKTDFFGYADLATFDQKYLGGAIVATRNRPVILTMKNLLPSRHILPVDPAIMAGPNGLTVGDLPVNRMVTHLHGGLTPWFSDGTPLQWYAPDGQHGTSFMNIPGYSVAAGTCSHYFPNQRSTKSTT